MIAPRMWGIFALGLIAAAAGCGGSPTDNHPALTPSAVAATSGNGQVGKIGTALTQPLVVRVTNTNGAPVKGVTVAFAVTSGSASVAPASAVTDSTGRAQTVVTLGSAPGSVIITATVVGTSLSATFNLTASTQTVTLACSSGPATTPAIGGVLPGVTGTGICLGGGASGAQYALVAFYGNPDSSQITPITVRSAGGVTGVTTASVSPLLAPSLDVAASAPGASFTLPGTNVQQTVFDARLRETARRELTPMIPAAQQYARQQASFVTIPANPAIGTLYTLNANGQNACSSPINIVARVAAVSNLAIVVADTANPAGGFTDAEYQSFATTFDTLISPVDVQNFGQPSDIDKNGKTIIFFTKEVNKLTPRGSPGVVGGFFFERDLFPTTSTASLQGCPASNYAEMYYSLVPDTGGVYSDKRSKSSVQAITPATLVHEFQHLINASRRLYVNNANAFEDTYLNEGLSHIAEELLYYRVAKLAPRQNINATIIRSSQAEVNAFNNYQGDNTGRYEVFLGKPNQTSVYAGNDSLETRGATWNLLRYLADHRGTSDGDTWFQLDNSTTTGKQNLMNVFGSNLLTQIRDWATSVFADDLPGQSDVRFSQPSWNYRDIFPHLSSSGVLLGRYPLAVLPLSDTDPVTVSIDAGGAAYIRFAVPAGSSASIDWSSGGAPVNALMQFTVVRSQ